MSVSPEGSKVRTEGSVTPRGDAAERPAAATTTTTTTTITATASHEQGTQPTPTATTTTKQRRPRARPKSAAEARRITLPEDGASADQFSPNLPAVSENRVAKPPRRAWRTTSSNIPMSKPLDAHEIGGWEGAFGANPARRPRPRTRRHSAPDVNRPGSPATSPTRIAQPRRLVTTVDRQVKVVSPILLQSDSRRSSACYPTQGLVDHRGSRLK